jgi:hypothetical protein
MNQMHAVHAWDRRRSKPIGPHGLAFLYADLDSNSVPRQPYYDVRIATRLFLGGPEVDDLVGLLYEMSDIAEGYLADGGVFDPLVHMTQRADDMSPQAYYIGVGVSTLDGMYGPWRDVQHRAQGALEVPGRCYALLADTTRMRIDRPARPHEQITIESTLNINTDGAMQYRPWRPLFDDPSDTVMASAWQYLGRLHAQATEGQRRRMAGAGPSAGRRAR